MPQPSGQKYHSENKYRNKANIYCSEPRNVASVTGIWLHIIHTTVENETYSELVVFHNKQLFWWQFEQPSTSSVQEPDTFVFNRVTLTLKSSTPSPISSTSPEHSKPKINGVFGGESIAPWRTIRSWKLSPLQPETEIVCQLSNWYHNCYKAKAVPQPQPQPQQQQQQQQQQIYTGNIYRPQKRVEVKVTLVQALRLCTGCTPYRGSRGIALPFLDHGTRSGWRVSVTFRPLFTPGKDPVPIVQEAGWAPGSVWTGGENLGPTGIRSPDRPARSQSLYRLSYRGPL